MQGGKIKKGTSGRRIGGSGPQRKAAMYIGRTFTPQKVAELEKAYRERKERLKTLRSWKVLEAEEKRHFDFVCTLKPKLVKE